MTAITITDLNNAKLDVDHIAELATSAALTATDRLGNTKRTMAGALDEYPNAFANAAEAAASAAAALVSEGNADTSEASALAAKVAAETARDAAFVNANVYANTTDGLAAVALNEQFQVVSGDAVIRYREDAGPVATEVARYPAGSGYAKQTIGVTDASVATTAWTAGRSYVLATPASIDGFVRKVYFKSLAQRDIRFFVATLSGGNFSLVRYVKTTTAGIANETIILGEDLPISAGQYLGVFLEAGAPYYVATASAGVYPVAGGFVTAAGIASGTVNAGITLGLGFDIEGRYHFERDRTMDRAAESSQDWRGVTYTALGTSITQNQFYPEMVAKRMGALLTNFGTGGQSWGGATRVISKRALMVDPRAELVTIEGPINDFRLNTALGSVRDTDAATSILGALYTMAQDLYEANPFRTIALVLSPPNMDAGYPGKWNVANGNGIYWNEVCEAVAKQADWLGIKVIKPENMNGFTTKWHAADLIHPDVATGAIQLANSVAFGVSRSARTRTVQCATPVVAFDIGTGQATITCSTASSTIRYTTDGSNPTTASTSYSGAFTPADGDTEIRAIATATGYARSPQRRMTVTKNTASGLGVGTWNLRPAVVGDITSTLGIVRSLEGGKNWSVDVEPNPINTAALWLASGANNAVEFECADIGTEFLPLVGIGATGWMGLGYPRVGSFSTRLRYTLATGAPLDSASFTSLPMTSANESSRKYRMARVGALLVIAENIYGTWHVITTGLDLSALSGATGYYETAQIGLQVPVSDTEAKVKNIRVGTLT